MNRPEFPGVALPFSDEYVVRTSFESLIQLILMLGALDVEFFVVPESLLMHKAILTVIRLVFANWPQVIVLCVS